jgi:hypothetical protein
MSSLRCGSRVQQSMCSSSLSEFRVHPLCIMTAVFGLSTSLNGTAGHGMAS